MSETFRIVEDLEISLKSRSGSERLQFLRSVTDLFLNGAAHHSDAQMELFDDVLCRLVQHVESVALAQLSAELAPVDTAPPQIVRCLARHDDIMISGPLLKQSKRLQVHDLVEIADTKSQAHLVAIGCRPEVQETVTDILVEKGNTEVARTIAINAGARFSWTGFSRLVARAESEDGLAELVVFRSEISSDQLRQLALKATETVRSKLMAVAKSDMRERVDRVLRDISSDIDRPEAGLRRDYSAGQRLVEGMRHDCDLMRSTLAQVAEHDEYEATVALLAAMGNVPIAAVERIMTGNDTGGILLLCKAIELEWPTVRLILPLHRAGKRASSAQLDSACVQFAKINASTAQRVVRFWQVRAMGAGYANAPPQRHQAAGDRENQDDWSNWTLH